jgi:hypothetical protein
VILKNVTITLDDELSRWTRIAAAEREMSVSRFIAETLRERMGRERDYEIAMRRNLRRKPVPMKKAGRYPRRDELYDRPVLRR